MRSTRRQRRLPQVDDFHEKLLEKGREKRLALAETESPSTGDRSNDLTPKTEVVYLPVGDLRPPERKTRKTDPAHIREVADSIGRLGFCVPVLIEADNRLIDGIVRWEAARQLGLETIPCIRVGHLSKSELRALRLALNRLGEKGEWDLDELRLEIEELVADDAPIEIIGFADAEIDDILAPDSAEEPDDGPLDPEAMAVARRGDLFRLGEHRILCGDSTDVAVLDRLMGGAVSRLVLTDPPYNVKIKGHVTGKGHREFQMASGEMSDEEYGRFNRAWMSAAMPHLRNGGLFASFIDWRGYANIWRSAEALGLAAINLAVWAKTNPAMGSLYRSQHELLPIFKKGAADHINNINLGKRGRHRSNVWTYPGASSIGSDARAGLKDHPTVKPTDMLHDAIIDLTNRGDVVLDPFLGSRSTLLACEKAGRTCHGVEIDPLYVHLTIRRFEAATGRKAILDGSDETFEELRVRRKAEQASEDEQ